MLTEELVFESWHFICRIKFCICAAEANTTVLNFESHSAASFICFLLVEVRGGVEIHCFVAGDDLKKSNLNGLHVCFFIYFFVISS